MIEDKQEVFSAFMNEFLKLDTYQKNEEIIEKQKIILAFLVGFATKHGIEFNLFKNKEINIINEENISNDDYLEAMMVYLQNIEELVGLILKKNI